MTALRAIRTTTAAPRYPEIAAAVADDVSAVIAEHRPVTDTKALHVLLLAAEIVAQRIAAKAHTGRIVRGRTIYGDVAMYDAVKALRSVQELEAAFYRMDEEENREAAIYEDAGELQLAAEELAAAWGEPE